MMSKAVFLVDVLGWSAEVPHPEMRQSFLMFEHAWEIPTLESRQKRLRLVVFLYVLVKLPRCCNTVFFMWAMDVSFQHHTLATSPEGSTVSRTQIKQKARASRHAAFQVPGVRVAFGKQKQRCCAGLCPSICRRGCTRYVMSTTSLHTHTQTNRHADTQPIQAHIHAQTNRHQEIQARKPSDAQAHRETGTQAQRDRGAETH